jgi:hypothetical protein
MPRLVALLLPLMFACSVPRQHDAAPARASEVGEAASAQDEVEVRREWWQGRPRIDINEEDILSEARVEGWQSLVASPVVRSGVAWDLALIRLTEGTLIHPRPASWRRVAVALSAEEEIRVVGRPVAARILGPEYVLCESGATQLRMVATIRRDGRQAIASAALEAPPESACRAGIGARDRAAAFSVDVVLSLMSGTGSR